MGCEVYANGDEIACKAGAGKVMAAFPDVCLTPPPPPAGPIPVPYPDTSFSKDMKNGSKTVMIKGKEVMLKDSSFYKSSPLGNEAATNGQGAGVMTHVITGKTYFVAWSMDVQFEGKNVDRHTDMTTSNHASPMANGQPPMLNAAQPAKADIDPLKPCPCCGETGHTPAGKPMSMEDWYEQHNAKKPNPPDPQAVKDLLKKATPAGRKSAGCTCAKMIPKPAKQDLLPKPPCADFYIITKDAKKKIEEEWAKTKPSWNKANNVPTYEQQIEKITSAPSFKRLPKKEMQRAKAKLPDEQDTALKRERQGNHLTPKSAGGCPGKPGEKGDGNIQANKDLCKVCQGIDAEFQDFQ